MAGSAVQETQAAECFLSSFSRTLQDFFIGFCREISNVLYAN